MNASVFKRGGVGFLIVPLALWSWPSSPRSRLIFGCKCSGADGTTRSCRHQFVYAPFDNCRLPNQSKSGMDFLCAVKLKYSIPINPTSETLADDIRFDLYGVQAFTYRDQTCFSRPLSCSWHSDQSGLMRRVTTHDFFRDADAASRNPIRAIPEWIKDKRKSK